MADPGLKIELSLDISPRVVSVARRFVEESMEKILDDADIAARVGMAAHELLENAAKYSVDKRAHLRVTCDWPGSGTRVVVSLLNRTTPEHVARLKGGFAEMEGADDPFEHYFDLMRRHSKQTDVSGLGLARIWAEGEMTLALEVKGDAVEIVASTISAQRS